MDYTEISVDPKFHRHLIGKGGVNSKYSVAV